MSDYYVPDLKLPEEHHPIGRWGRLGQCNLEQYRSMLYHDLILSSRLPTVLVDLNEHTADSLDLIIRQMMEAGGNRSHES